MYEDISIAEEENHYVEPAIKSETPLSTLLTNEKKIVSFVGTTKNGTSFVVNNTAEMLASMGIETAILDMTKSKNAYYIYTNNEEELRLTARDCMENLQRGIAAGIKVNKNLTVYTEMPGEEKEYDVETVLETLVNNKAPTITTKQKTKNNPSNTKRSKVLLKSLPLFVATYLIATLFFSSFDKSLYIIIQLLLKILP